MSRYNNLYGKKEDSSIFWLIVFVIILSPFVLLSPQKERSVENHKRRFSNIVGSIVLLTVCAGIFVHTMFMNQMNAETKKTMNEVARGFADHDEEIMMAWAKGEYLDAWKNCIILEENDEDVGVSFVSKGPDGELGTEDDLVSNRIPMSEKPVPKLHIVVETVPKKGVGTRVKEGWGKVKGLFGGGD